MGVLGSVLGGPPGYVASNISNTATVENIRDRIQALLESLLLGTMTDVKFRRYRNEGGAIFEEWAEAHPNAALRRFQVREVGDDQPPEVSTTTEERVRVRYRISIAYPHSHRYGNANAMDRDDVMNADWKFINLNVGIYGRGNFSGSNDCTPLGAVKAREQGTAIDYLVIEAEYEYVRSTT